MKYEIGKYFKWHIVSTNFVVTDNLKSLLSLCKGTHRMGAENRYEFQFRIPSMFDVEDVYSNLSAIMDAYIASNQHVSDIEHNQLVERAGELKFYRFLDNYLK